jgi:3-oxoacyl-[acyl-carrier protein] reductase
MMACKHGRIVNNASIAGQIGHPDIWYGITKSGILNATKSFAKSLGPQGIQVNAVAVSPVETEMLQYIAEERRNLFLATTTEKRFATSDEVAKTMVWLATEAPPYLNGACIDLNSAAYVR